MFEKHFVRHKFNNETKHKNVGKITPELIFESNYEKVHFIITYYLWYIHNQNCFFLRKPHLQDFNNKNVFNHKNIFQFKNCCDRFLILSIY